MANSGCPLAAPVNNLVGRKGAIFLSALLILISSVGSAAIPLDSDDEISKAWKRLTYLRIVGGIAMGLKSVSTPILAAECSTGMWRRQLNKILTPCRKEANNFVRPVERELHSCVATLVSLRFNGMRWHY
jgi:MFS family permease